MTRVLAIGLAASFALAPAPAFADPAAPTDYRTEVVSIAPESEHIDVRIIGVDAFVELTADVSTDVIVMGYSGEPYLWFRGDGAVLENRNSPATAMNTSRNGAMPDGAQDLNPDAAPDWEQVGSDHRWAWHDHRAHWMQSGRPVGAEPGDEILQGVIPLEVDGTPVAVTVAGRWAPAASTVPMWLGVVCGVLFAVGALLCRRRRLPTTPWLVPPAVLALVAGLWQYVSLPAATAPPAVWWVLPAIAVTCALGGMLAELGRARFWADAAMLAVGVELAIWGWSKRDGLSAALIPTGAPGWFDRFAVAVALVGGAAFVALSLGFLFAVGQRRPTDRDFAGIVNASRRQRVQGGDGLAAPGPPVSTS
jgi:hypothetical protein